MSSPAVLGRLKDFCKPYDFVVAPVIRERDLHLDEEAEKPILVTRFTKDSQEWSTATYYNVPRGETYSIATGESDSEKRVSVRSYRSVLNAYVNNAESKFNGPDGNQCRSWTRGVLQRMHAVASEHRYCGKEFQRKLEQGPVDHEVEFKCEVYENGRVVAAPETLRQLANFSERSENFVKDVEYILVCGIIWKKRADRVVGWELIRGLNTHDQYLREIANGILVECGQPSMELLENGRKMLRYRLLRRNPFAGDRTPVEVRRLLWKKQELKTI